MSKTFEPGTHVRMTGKFLRSTGQVSGGDGKKRFTVQVCKCSLCATGRFVATNEQSMAGYFTPDEMAEEPGLKYRHVASANLERVR